MTRPDTWLKPDGTPDFAAATRAVRDLQRLQSQTFAAAQRAMTALTAALSDDWEERYLAEGLVELEGYANS